MVRGHSFQKPGKESVIKEILRKRLRPFIIPQKVHATFHWQMINDMMLKLVLFFMYIKTRSKLTKMIYESICLYV